MPSISARPDPNVTVSFVWSLYPSFRELVQEADAFVVGEVIAVKPGGERGEDFAVPQMQSRIWVTDVAKGSIERCATVVVEQSGGVQRDTHVHVGETPRPPFWLDPEDNPIFRVGERVALALDWNPRIRVYQFPVQGRFEVDGQGSVHPIRPQDPVVAGLDGLSIQQLLTRVAAPARK